MKRFLIAFFGFAIAFATAGMALSHNDSPDTNRCDTWWRNGHQTPTAGATTSHHDTRSGGADQGDINVNDPVNHTYIHKHPAQGDANAQDVGHYVVSGDRGYVEVVGGGSYQRPNPPGGGNQGGFVQGEVEPVAGHDADFHVSTFSGTNNNGGKGMVPGPAYTEANFCVTVDNTPIYRWHNPTNPGT